MPGRVRGAVRERRRPSVRGGRRTTKDTLMHGPSPDPRSTRGLNGLGLVPLRLGSGNNRRAAHLVASGLEDFVDIRPFGLGIPYR